MSKNIYYAAAYMRISDSDNNLDESNSIKNQRDLIKNFVSKNADIILCSEKIDDGYSGINFTRPAFKTMMEEIKKGNINCVIVKDLSRFGRNYIESGDYIERIFPFWGVRFIAINDYIDTISKHYQHDNITVPLKNLINDFYSRDISVKIRSQFDVKRKKGDFIGSFAVYGYLKDKCNKNHLVIDEFASLVVKDIFKWKLLGMSNYNIAERLNKLCIASPSDYKILLGFNYTTGFKLYSKSKWNAVTVRRILTNEMYIGNMVQGKEFVPNYRIKKRIAQSSDKWIKAENTHDAIIKKEDFNLVQKMFSIDMRISPKEDTLYLLSGFMFCGNCNRLMVRKLVKKYAYYICSLNKENNKKCTSHIVSESQVKISILLFLKNFIDIDNIFYEDFDEKQKLYDNISNIEYKIYNLKKLNYYLKEDLKKDVITENEYLELKNIYAQQILQMESQIFYLKERQNLNKEIFYKNSFSRNLLHRIIKNIIVYKDKRIEINFDFKDIII